MCAAVRSLAVCLALSAFVVAGCSLGDNQGGAPQIGDKGNDVQPGDSGLAFPSSATRNTVRVGGDDAAADVAGVASAMFPATSDANRPTAVVLVDQDDWQTAIAAAVLAGPPIGAPLLLANGSDLPDVTKETLDRLKPKGSDLSKDAQVIRIGQDIARPAGFKTAVVEGDDAFERAASIDRFVSAARGRPSADVVLYSADDPEWAMSAAAWAARSGDAALPVKHGSVPAPIVKAIRSHESPNLYLLGPDRAISAAVERQLRRQKLARAVTRIAGRTPVENAVAFARYQRGDFGWGVNVPGYNFAVANVDRPTDSAAAASLATRGVFAPLLLTNDARSLPAPLRDYLLSVQPGYENDPAQAVYNRAWILGDDQAVSVGEQAQIDAVTELIPVQTNAP
jgi:hypothetical protein